MKKLIRLTVLAGAIISLGVCSQQVTATTTGKSDLTQQENSLIKTSSSLKEKLHVKQYQASSLKKAWNSQTTAAHSSDSSQAASSAVNSSSATATTTTESSSSTAKVTVGQGKIIGNRDSHIYHVPGQAGYKMNAANAVYFATEAQAQAAGYRKALR
ncbi:MAG: hypothetical protein ABF756_00470 [Liquorilactobacillus ghanensis]|uniref:sunset domain-containing protein n=1 Tax=Liquorilactobacillus ghanensis TaxID=399370 RepID=UPI0039EC1739